MTTTNTDGRARKSLAEQIDRLDRVLDGLAEGLNEAVAAAVREAAALAVKEAVQAVLLEVLTNPAVLERLRGAAAPAAAGPPAAPPVKATPEPGLRERLGRAWGRIGPWLKADCLAAGALIRQAPRACAALFRRARQTCTSSWVRLRALRRFKVPLLTALGVGVAAGAAAYLSGPWLAAGVSALAGFAATLAVHAGLWLRGTLGRDLGSGYAAVAGTDAAA